MAPKTPLIKARPISGFPEWLPAQQHMEDHCIRTISSLFESFGYAHIETSAVELTDVIAAKGVEQKEIYNLTRFHAAEDEKSRFSLHFDLTVPFARYVAQNQSSLVFPFKRYQIQKVWRGERPAQGRFREFYQCDIDVVGIDSLPLSYDAELLDVIGTVFSTLGVGNVVFKLNHRTLLQGFYDYLGVDELLRNKVLQEVDKLSKTGEGSVAEQLKALSLPTSSIDKILAFASLRANAGDLASVLETIGASGELFEKGAQELQQVMSLVPPHKGINLEWDGSITRGLNYYTGTVFETMLNDAPGLGSICSGGRYDDLAGMFTRVKLPGVGISIGLTRLLAHLFAQGKADGEAITPTQLLLVVLDEQTRRQQVDLATELRSCGMPLELSFPGKLKKQLNYANKKGIPLVVIPNEGGLDYEFKNMENGEQCTLGRQELIAKCQELTI